jgi:hypothetical protein
MATGKTPASSSSHPITRDRCLQKFYRLPFFRKSENQYLGEVIFLVATDSPGANT